jgi:hypothetical protein
VRKLLWNWPVWLGFLFSLLAFTSYSLVFARFPATRNVPWVNFLLFGVSAAFLFFGLKRMLGGAQSVLGKMVSSILIFLSISIFWVFALSFFMRRSSCLHPPERRRLARMPLNLLCVIRGKTWFRLQPFYPLRSICQIHPGAPQKECFSSFIAAIGDRSATPS